MRRLTPFLLSLLLVHAAFAAEKPRPNVLFIAADDLNDWIGALGGHPQVKTPHLDALAARGTVFTNAHTQAPLCNPSRASLLLGLRPSSTGICGLSPGARSIESLRDRTSLPQAFGKAGYRTATSGKIWHDGSLKPAFMSKEFDVVGPAPGMPKSPKRLSKYPANHPAVDWGIFPEDDKDQADWKIADAAIDAIRTAPADRPFFVACGFRLPHVPCVASKPWFDLYPDATLKMPPVLETDRDDTPRFSWYLHWKLPEPRLAGLRQFNEWRPLVRAYLASVSFMDSQVGRVLTALKESGREQDTIIVFWSDHGWHLGEKLITGKNTLWERSTHVPLIFAGPGIAGGARCAQPAELLDMFPTLLDLAALPKVDGLEGISLRPQLTDAATPRERPAITTHNRGNHSIRDLHWRYIHYADGSEELYDLQTDPNEWTNLATNPAHAATKARLAKWLPQPDQPPTPGSAARVLTPGPTPGTWIWEGKPIGADEPIPTLLD